MTTFSKRFCNFVYVFALVINGCSQKKGLQDMGAIDNRIYDKTAIDTLSTDLLNDANIDDAGNIDSIIQDINHPDSKHPGLVRTIAGDGTPGFADGPANKARFKYPTDVAVDKAGKVYVAEGMAHRIRVVYGGVVNTLSGDGTAGYQDGPVSKAKFSGPLKIAVDSKGAIIVADRDNHRIRSISAGKVATLAGTGEAGFANGIFNKAKINTPLGVAVGIKGEIYVSDSKNFIIRKIQNGMVSTLAGSGLPGMADGPLLFSKFNMLMGLDTNTKGEILVADFGNRRIRVISATKVTTIASGGTSSCDKAQLCYPSDVAVDYKDRIYIADAEAERILMIEKGKLSTLTGGTAGYADGPLKFSKFNKPMGIAVDSVGKIYVADTFNHMIRLIVP